MVKSCGTEQQEMMRMASEDEGGRSVPLESLRSEQSVFEKPRVKSGDESTFRITYTRVTLGYDGACKLRATYVGSSNGHYDPDIFSLVPNFEKIFAR